MAVPCFASPGALSVFRRGAFQTNVQLLRPALIATGRSFQASRIVTSSDMGSVMGSPNLVSPQEAHTLKESAVGWVHLDVRTVEEFADGHAPDSTNIPYLIRGGLSMVCPRPVFCGFWATRLMRCVAVNLLLFMFFYPLV